MPDGDQVRFVTCGAANTSSEHWSVPRGGSIGRVVYRIPHLGFAIAWLVTRFVRPGGTYNVYAQATDTGNPASGISSVTADVSAISSGQTAASTITITLGTQSGAGTTAASAGTMVWSPSTAATDRAGNPMSATTRSETGSADKDF